MKECSKKEAQHYMWQGLLVINPIFIFLFLSSRSSVYLGPEMCSAEEHFPASLAGVSGHVKLLGPMEF